MQRRRHQSSFGIA